MILGDLRARQRPEGAAEGGALLPNIIRFPMEIDVKSSRAMPRAMPIPGPPLGQAPGPLKKDPGGGPVPRGGRKRSLWGSRRVILTVNECA